MRFTSALALAAASLAMAQDSDQSLCDKYTTALFTDNNSTNQYKLLVAVVNTALIGNFIPKPLGSNSEVSGILASNASVNLLPYFDGGLLSSNRGKPVAINFLDDGGAAPLMNLMPSNGTSSNQYKLVTHLYEFFGILLGCSTLGSQGFPAYSGQASMYAVHAYMDLNVEEMNYFIGQVGAAAASFGVTSDDVTTVANALNTTFNYRCTPAANLTGTAELQAICIDPSCPITPTNPNCAAYGEVLVPMIANASLADGEGTSSTVTLLTSGQTSATVTSSSGSVTPVTSIVVTTSTGVSTTVTSTATVISTPTGNLAAATAAPIAAAVMAAGAFVLAL